MLIHENTGAVARERRTAWARDADDDLGGDASALSWLLPWVLALAGILITLALTR